MAAKWEQFAEDGDRYYLQYRTAHDDKVRPEHAALEGVTLPMSDPFWETYYPPNGWNCRCTVAQVRKQKYPATPHDEAMQRGQEALDGERYNIFRFNSGKQGKAMPDYNPYTIRRCNDCDVAKGGVTKLAFPPGNEVCAACRLLQVCANNREKSESAKERMHYTQKEMGHLLSIKVRKEIGGRVVKVGFDMKCNKHLFSDIKLRRTRRMTLEDLRNMHYILEGAEFVGDAPPEAGHRNGYEHFYYFEADLSGGRVRLNIGKKTQERENGRRVPEYFCYSVNNA